MKIRNLKPGEKVPMKLLLQADPSKRMVKEYVDRGQCFIAEIGQEIIGAFVLLPTRPGTVEIVNIAVAEEKRGRGIGKQLIEEAIKISKKAGYKTIEVGTGNSSVGQLVMYQKCGFRITDIDSDFFIIHYDEAIYENGIQCKDMIRLSQNL
ncbi:GNAT family N-acetyltransferase [Salinicoccus sp. YB14-2]|uniref:GNAT family N-acetyltransferase n=1 Tax=Salinicoccus sp. YB14-2 TaxID=1572701 RepID=UPI0006923D84|nr:GNAT family N-acetyltransferase [Salinicoccus sp. YB14-2]